MTEHYLAAASGTNTTSITDALAAAQEIHAAMTVGQYNAYVWWWVVNSSSTGVATGLVDTNSNPTFFGYALAHYARFVRPGYVRVNAPASPGAGVYLSAYSGSGHAVLVAINANTTAASLLITIQSQSVRSLTPYQTTAAGGLVPLSPISVTGDAFTATLPAQSITTHVSG